MLCHFSINYEWQLVLCDSKLLIFGIFWELYFPHFISQSDVQGYRVSLWLKQIRSVSQCWCIYGPSQNVGVYMVHLTVLVCIWSVSQSWIIDYYRIIQRMVCLIVYWIDNLAFSDSVKQFWRPMCMLQTLKISHQLGAIKNLSPVRGNKKNLSPVRGNKKISHRLGTKNKLLPKHDFQNTKAPHPQILRQAYVYAHTCIHISLACAAGFLCTMVRFSFCGLWKDWSTHGGIHVQWQWSFTN